MQTMTASTADLVARLEKELTSVQAKKTKAVDALAKLRMEKRKEAGESKGNELVSKFLFRSSISLTLFFPSSVFV